MRARVGTWIDDDHGQRLFGPGPAELLERTRATGSLHAAACPMDWLDKRLQM